MSKQLYVLMDTDNTGGGFPLGVFDSPDISDDTLSEYFGKFTTKETIDIRDSGLEWQKTIHSSAGKSVLTLHYFNLNEMA